VLIVGVCGYFIDLKEKKLLESNAGYVIVNSTLNYSRDLQLIANIREDRAEQTYPGLRLLDDNQQTEKTYIFIIGEAANRNHLSLYGYQRETSPELKKLGARLNYPIVAQNTVFSSRAACGRAGNSDCRSAWPGRF
jgi:glucan phosphoethanolaminetransferase (alkaline phosphatase superfamily)